MGIQDIGLPAQRASFLGRMLHSRRLRWRTAFSYALIIIILMALMTAIILRAMNRHLIEATRVDLATQAAASAQSPTLIDAWNDPLQLGVYLPELSAILNADIAAFDADARPMAGFPPTAIATDAAIVPPEVRSALANGTGFSLRVDEATNEMTIYVAHAVVGGGDMIGALRLARSTAAASAVQDALRRLLLLGIGLVGLGIIALMVFQAERAARTVRQLTDVAERITAGDLGARIIAYSSGEIGQLSRAFNRMASNLESQIRKSEQETDRLNTVLYAMTDGVIIVDKKGNVELINRGAARLLNTNGDSALQQSFVQVVRDHRIAEVWQKCRASGGQETQMVDLPANRFLQVVVTPLLKGADRGYLVILQDLTRTRQLQTIRQDFVSNVSHELRTPLAALRALVETLRDGAIDDPPVAQRFLDRMETEVDALTQMVQELLDLSRIESGQDPLRLYSVTVADALRPGIERLRMQAERADIHLSLDLPPGLPNVVVDVDRIQQVVTNLVHNAIKFTPPGGRITISASGDLETVTVAVQDTGVGIPVEDLQRVFERFYKADRARASGGTGLGLAIAKHIVHAHAGDIWVESRQGEGSCFYFTLPQHPPQRDSLPTAPAPHAERAASAVDRTP